MATRQTVTDGQTDNGAANQTGKLVAFHDDPKIKAKYLRRVRAHAKADELVKGATGQNGKGCAVWCTLNEYEHGAYETKLGIPEMICRWRSR